MWVKNMRTAAIAAAAAGESQKNDALWSDATKEGNENEDKRSGRQKAFFFNRDLARIPPPTPPRSCCNFWAGDTLILYKTQEIVGNNTAEPF